VGGVDGGYPGRGGYPPPQLGGGPDPSYCPGPHLGGP